MALFFGFRRPSRSRDRNDLALDYATGFPWRLSADY